METAINKPKQNSKNIFLSTRGTVDRNKSGPLRAYMMRNCMISLQDVRNS